MQYAGLVFRIGALILDLILYALSIFLTPLGILVLLFLNIVLEIRQGNSLGKKVFGLHVVSTKGTKLSWGRVLGRACVSGLAVLSILGAIVSFLLIADNITYDWIKYKSIIGILLLIPGFVSLITMLFSATKQTFYDKWFGSVVLSKYAGSTWRFVLALAEIGVAGLGLLILLFLTTNIGFIMWKWTYN